MAVPGVAPKASKIGRTPNLDWTEVANRPFRSPKRRDLPKTMLGLPVPPPVRRWWAALRVMPHCTLWTETDWQYAIATAELKTLFHSAPSSSLAAELRQREDQMGTTVEARRKLRIRYVDFVPPAQAAEDRAAAPPAATVTSLASRRARLEPDE